jgi:hypothetical protein
MLVAKIGSQIGKWPFHPVTSTPMANSLHSTITCPEILLALAARWQHLNFFILFIIILYIFRLPAVLGSVLRFQLHNPYSR